MEEIKSSRWKKPAMVLVLALALTVGVFAAAVGGYKLFTAVSHFNVQEGVEVQYWDGAAWQPLAVNGGTFDLGTATIKAGETNSFTLRARNTASSGVLGLHLEIESATGLTHDVLCNANSNSLQYTKRADNYWFKAPADSVWRSIDVTTTADGGIGVGAIEFDNTLTRGNAETSYEATC